MKTLKKLSKELQLDHILLEVKDIDIKKTIQIFMS